MMKICKLKLIAMLVALAANTAFADTVALKAELSPSSEVPPPSASSGHGVLDATLDTSTRALQWTVSYEDLSSPVTAAHFHGPAPVGQNADVMVPIDKDALADPIRGAVTLTEEQMNGLLDGQWYFNIHTEQNQKGEIRGQVTPGN
jgi:hypothetical protein